MLPWESTPLINLLNGAWTSTASHPRLMSGRLLSEETELHGQANYERPINFHKRCLGKQSYTWQGEFRFWVWESADKRWRVFVSNIHGVSFEARQDLSQDEAVAAWDDYRAKMGLVTA